MERSAHDQVDVKGAAMFRASGSAYDSFMGRYSGPLAVAFADFADVRGGQQALDVGCGPGALTSVLVARLGARSVHAVEPSPSFAADCAARHAGVDVRVGRAEAIEFGDASFDRVLAQLVLHFVDDSARAVSEMGRVSRPGGVVAACVWDFADGMEMLRSFWDAALVVDPAAPDEARTMRFGREGELTELLTDRGLDDVVEATLEVRSAYGDFEELWAGFMAGIGPAGSFCVSLADDRRLMLREELYRRVGSPGGRFTLRAVARCARGVVSG